MTETRSRSARKAIPSSPSKMAFFRKKRESNEMREYFSTPSFSFESLPGEIIEAASADDLKRIIRKNGKMGVIFLPSVDVLVSPRKWVSAFADIPYLVIIGRKSIPEFSELEKLSGRLVFSPVPKALSSVFMTEDPEKAYDLLHGAGYSSDDIMIIRAGGQK